MKTVRICSLVCIVAVLVLCIQGSVVAATRTSVTNGNWATAATWGGTAPVAGDDAVIASGTTVTVAATATITNLTVNAGGTLAGASALTVTGNLTNSGSITYTGTMVWSGTGQTIDGTIVFANTPTFSGGAKTFAATATLTFPNSMTIPASVTFTNNGTVTNQSTGTGIVGANAASTWVNGTNATLNLTGPLMVTGVLTATATGNTINYNRAGGTQTVKAANYYNLTLSGARTTSNITLPATGTVGVAGTFNPSATFTSGNYITTGSTISFNGSAAQTVPAFAYNNLTLNNGTGFTLGGAASVTGTLTFTAGVLDIGANNLTVATVSGGSATSYVATSGTGGLIRTVGATNVSFPVGTTTTFNPAILNNAGTSDSYTVKVASAFTNAPPTPANCVTRDWTVTEGVAGGSNLTVTLQWGSADEGGGFVRAGSISMGVFSTQWNEAIALLGGADPYTAVAGGITSVGEFAVGNVGALPIQLASFNAVAAGSNTVNLAWSTISETNNYGFEVQKSQTNDAYQSIAGSFQKGAGTTIDPKNYSYVDASATPGTWYYRLRQIDIDGTDHYSDAKRIDIASSTTGVATAKEKPTVYSLAQNYPNPFNPSTMIHFGIPTGGLVTLKVYNLLGQEVATLVNEQRSAGYHDVVFDGKNLSSGMYVYRLTAGEFSSVKTLVLVK